jgi:hypothetical protein
VVLIWLAALKLRFWLPLPLFGCGVALVPLPRVS